MCLLEDLRTLRELQLAQLAAAGEGDVERLQALGGDRAEVQARLVPVARSGLAGVDRAEAEALAELLVQDEPRLVAAAQGARERMRLELATLGRGRVAVSGYRPTPRTRSHFLDSTG